MSKYTLARFQKVAEFGAMKWTWRGVLSRNTVLKLTVLGLGLWDINLLSQVVVEQGAYISCITKGQFML